MSLYLVTGGAGFIGSNIVEELLKRGESVRVLDNLITGSKENLSFTTQYALPRKAPSEQRGRRTTSLDSARDRHYEFIEGDIRSKEDIARALKGVDYVIHQAALRSVAKSVEDPFLTNEINITGTLNLLYESKKVGIKRFVYASTSACYGNATQFPQKEDLNPRPVSPYGVSKLAAEYYCSAAAVTLGLETVSLRYFNVFGPKQNPESKYSAAIPALLSRMLNNKPPIVEWDGMQSRDFVYVKNVVEANLKGATAPEVSGGVFNIGVGDSVSILDLVKAFNDILGKDLKPEYAPKRPGDVKKTYADITKTRQILGFEPKISFQDGLKETVEWFKQNKGRLLEV